MSQTLDEMLRGVTGDLPGCLHTSVIDAQTGLALVSVSDTDGQKAAGADAFLNDLYRLGEDVVDALPASDELHEIILRSDEATLVSVPVEQTGYIWLVAVEPETTVGFVQAMMRKHVERIEEGLGALVG